MRIVFVQYGDYGEAVRRFAEGGEETYYAQRYAVGLVEGLIPQAEDVCVICVASNPYETTLSNGVRAIGFRLYHDTGVKRLIEVIGRQDPTHIVLHAPIPPVVRWSNRERLKMLPAFANSFPGRGPKAWLRHKRLAWALNSERISIVSNHNVNACKALVAIGVDPRKIVPYDWPPAATPGNFSAKSGPSGGDLVRLIFVGELLESKGVTDCILASAKLNRAGRPTRLTVVGGGQPDRFAALARDSCPDGSVDFVGRVPHRRVLELMRQSDAVIVPSRHEYSEGLPHTIYDAYCTRTPLIASDHPMFRGKVRHGESGLVFPAGNPEALAVTVDELVSDAALYSRLSANSQSAWERLQCPVRWGDLLQRWISDTADDRQWLASRSLSSQCLDDE
jgi:glycosyltransferase involved in cell wall biosynthesis